MKKLYKFYSSCNTSGSVEGIFIADEKIIKSAIGCNVWFGELLGKNSNIYGTLEKEDLTIINVSDITINEMEEVLGTNISGYNPLDYITYICSRCAKKFSVKEATFYMNKEGNIICHECLTDGEKDIFEEI
ncbi:hypothetical protein [Clostridium tagluense]|uniref:Uncharacterized protein n=1 Tax=Clostridium tagluense TaxID=360422 RepID=A0A401UQA9_9CLOT|nr:hypothetical protein [Clostridium tagluense]GCD11706.1 hypothetical protein Ctaglu_33290 [Clostridium tagluense]